MGSIRDFRSWINPQNIVTSLLVCVLSVFLTHRCARNRDVDKFAESAGYEVGKLAGEKSEVERARDEALSEIENLSAQNEELARKLPIFATFGAQMEFYREISLAQPDDFVVVGNCEKDDCYQFQMLDAVHDPAHVVFRLEARHPTGNSITGIRFRMRLKHGCTFVASRGADEMVVSVLDDRVSNLRMAVVIQPVAPGQPQAGLPVRFSGGADCGGVLISG